MHKQDELHKLIKSLTKSEKRYFTINAAKIDGNKNYLKLFEIIDSQKEYNEEDAKQKLSKKGVQERYAITKKYLFDVLIETLINYTSYDTVKYKLQETLKQIEVLESREVFSICLDHIQRAKKLAWRHEYFPELISLNRIEDKVKRKIVGRSYSDTNIVTAEYEKIIDYYTNFLAYEKLQKKIEAALITSTTQVPELNELWNNALLQDESRAISMRSKNVFYFLQILKHGIEGDYAKQYYYAYRSLLHYEKMFEKELYETPHVYLMRINNFLISAIHAKQFEHADHYFQKLQEFEQLKIKVEYKVLAKQYYYRNILDYLYCIKKFDEAIVRINKIESDQFLLGKHVKNNFREAIYNSCFRIFFLAGDYKMALHFINQLVNQKYNAIAFWGILARMLSLITHFELGNESNILYEIESMERILKPLDQKPILENILLLHFKEILKISDSKQANQLYDILISELKKTKQNATEKLKFEYFDFILWAESKRQRKSMKVLL